MTEHREICTGQPCGCCPTCGAWRWRGTVCVECGHGSAGVQVEAQPAPGADRPAAKTTSDLVSLFDLTDTQPPTTKRIVGTGEDLI